MFKFRYKKALAFCLMLNTSFMTANCMESKLPINNREKISQKGSDNLKKAKKQVEDLVENFFMRIANYVGNPDNKMSEFILDEKAKDIFKQILDLYYSYNFDNVTKNEIELIREIMENNFLIKKFEKNDFRLWFGLCLLLYKYSLYDIGNVKQYLKFNECVYRVRDKIVFSGDEDKQVYLDILSNYKCIMEINRFWTKQRTSEKRLKFKHSSSNLIWGFRVTKKKYFPYFELIDTEATSWNVLYQIYYPEFANSHKYLDKHNEKFKIYDIASTYGFTPVNDMLMVKDKKKYGKISFHDYLFVSSRNYSRKKAIGFINHMFNEENEE